jgi:GNAT superfamily N-acetyltransferase
VLRRHTVDPGRVPRDLARLRRRVFPAERYGGFASGVPLMARHGSWVVVARVDGRLVGWAWATPAPGTERQLCVIDEVGVLLEHRGEGIARALCRETASWMVELGFDTIWITAFGGPAAMDGQAPWFLGLGFDELGGGTFAAEATAIASMWPRGEPQ